ncbi:MAG: hypothetical protein NT045_03695, partial [Candidatus Aureabacteria bacterium]|nr:hypothetical protein [Candidatus Auribacterota bacterium]
MMNGYARGHAAPLFAVFLAATFCLSTFDITEHDYWWHLATGRYIIEGGWVPHRDVFSYTATRPWVAHYWLADVIGYTLYRFIGTPGLILLNAALITLSFSLVLRVALSAATPFIAVAASVVAVYASRSRFYVRPETVSFLFSGVYLWLLYRWKRTGAVWPLF